MEATVVTGFESAAKSEALERLDVEASTARGRILFDLNPEEAEKVLKFRCIDNLYCVMSPIFANFKFKYDTDEDLQSLSDLVDQVDWERPLKAWRKVFGLDKVTTFRCTCYRSGEKSRHKFSSMEAAKIVGGKINDKFGWDVKMKGFDLEVVLNIGLNDVHMSLGLTHQSLFKRNVTHMGLTTLRATICASLLRLAKVEVGDVVVDPMCGGGSIPIEGGIGPDTKKVRMATN